MSIERYLYHPLSLAEDAAGIPARITAVHRGERYSILCAHGTALAHLKAGDYYHQNDALFPTVGDFVLLDWQAQGESRILETLPRKSYFARLDPSSSGQREQAVAANFDYVFLLQALDRDFNLRRLERYLTLAWQSGAVPAVLLTKTDLLEDPSHQIRAVEQMAAGVGVFPVSAKTGFGFSALTPYLGKGKSIVLLGSSGVGKSSLINALAGETVAETGEIRTQDSRGRHTTARRQLFHLPGGVMLIDTPGMRELGMWAVDEGLDASFSDVTAYLDRCRFRDCRHQSEPGCAVKQAIQRGALSLERWESYCRLDNEARYQTDKGAYLKDKQQWHKEIVKMQREKRKAPFRHVVPPENFLCAVCGSPAPLEGAGTQHRNHCPQCLCSLHLDNKPGDRASLCKGVMDPIGVWVRKDGEWALIHRCRDCGTLHSNRIAADDNQSLLLHIAEKPIHKPPFPSAEVACREKT